MLPLLVAMFVLLMRRLAEAAPVQVVFLRLHAQNKKTGYLKNLTETKSIEVHINAATDGKVEPTGKDVWENKPNSPR